VLLTWLVLITRQSFALVVLPLLLPRQDPHTRPESRLLKSISPKPGWEGSALRNKVQGKGNVGFGSFSMAEPSTLLLHVPHVSLPHSNYRQASPFGGS
jgi:hypothetical protein